MRNVNMALVTGASSGIGMEICRLLASKNIPVIMTGRNIDRLNSLAFELRENYQNKQDGTPQIISFDADLQTDEGRYRVVQAIWKYAPDLIVNNAGIGLYGNALSHDTKEHLRLIEVNILALTEFTLEGAKAMSKANKGGVILNISSACDHLVFPDFSVYAASKAYVTSFSTSLYYEMLPLGVHVLTASPGMVSTNFRKRASGGNVHSSLSSMSSEFAAKELWKQIQNRKKRVVFDWKTRLGLLLAKCLPEKWSACLLSYSIRRP